MPAFLSFAESLATSASQRQGSIAQVESYVQARSNPSVPPLPNNGPVMVQLGLSLEAIREVDTEKNELEIMAMLVYNWTDSRLAWQNVLGSGPATNRTRKVSLDKAKVWSPDIVAYNTVTSPELLSPEIVVVTEDGTVLYVPLVRIRFRCSLGNVDSDRGSVCVLRLGSWTHDSDTVMTNASGVNLEGFESDPEYELVESASVNFLVRFQCCEGAYSQARYSFNIKKRPGAIESFFNL